MNKKPDFDLSNLGGRPKTWLDQNGSDEVWLGDIGMVLKIILPIVALLGCAFLFLVTAFQ